LRYFNKRKNTKFISPVKAISRKQARIIVETSYLAAATSLLWIALYYLPIGGAVFRLALPLPLALLQIRKGFKAGFEGLILLVLLTIALMGPVRGPLVLFPYGLLAFWLGRSWLKGLSWWISWGIGTLIGLFGFLVRVSVLSILVGENLWVIITRAGYTVLDRLIDLLNLPIVPDLIYVQLISVFLVAFQELIYVLTLHVLAFWIFSRLKVSMPEPPQLLYGLISLDPL